MKTPLAYALDERCMKDVRGNPYDDYIKMRHHSRDLETRLAAATARVVELEAQITEMDIAMSNLKFFAGKYLDMVDAKMEKKEVAHERDIETNK